MECSATNSVSNYWINRTSIKWDIKQLHEKPQKVGVLVSAVLRVIVEALHFV